MSEPKEPKWAFRKRGPTNYNESSMLEELSGSATGSDTTQSSNESRGTKKVSLANANEERSRRATRRVATMDLSSSDSSDGMLAGPDPSAGRGRVFGRRRRQATFFGQRQCRAAFFSRLRRRGRFFPSTAAPGYFSRWTAAAPGYFFRRTAAPGLFF